MNYNPQQQYNQQYPRVPQPPRNNTKLVIILSLVAALVFGGLFYFVYFVGRSMGTAVGNVSRLGKNFDSAMITINNEIADATNSFQHYHLINEINSDSVMADSLKTKLTGNLNVLRKNANGARQLVKLYLDGFRDTLPDKRKFSSFNKKWAHAYFIESGRAANLKQSLSTLQDQTLNNLPDKAQASRFANIINIYDNSANQSTSWENVNFDNTSDLVRVNLIDIQSQIESFEKTVLDQYQDYIEKR